MIKKINLMKRFIRLFNIEWDRERIWKYGNIFAVNVKWRKSSSWTSLMFRQSDLTELLVSTRLIGHSRVFV